MALVVPLIEGRRLQWPLWLLALPRLAAIGLVLFWQRQRSLAWHHGAALVDPQLMRRPFVRALVTVLVFYCSNASCILIVSLWLRSVYELRPIAAAAVYTAMSVGFIGTTFGGRAWFARWGDGLLVFGAGALALGQLAIALQLHWGSRVVGAAAEPAVHRRRVRRGDEPAGGARGRHAAAGQGRHRRRRGGHACSGSATRSAWRCWARCISRSHRAPARKRRR